MGGVRGLGKQNDVFVFDIEFEQMQKVVEGGLLKYRSYKNSCVTIANKTVVALVYGQEEYKRDMPHLINFKLGSCSINTI